MDKLETTQDFAGCMAKYRRQYSLQVLGMPALWPESIDIDSLSLSQLVLPILWSNCIDNTYIHDSAKPISWLYSIDSMSLQDLAKPALRPDSMDGIRFNYAISPDRSTPLTYVS